jgi:hypothetical protein
MKPEPAETSGQARESDTGYRSASVTVRVSFVVVVAASALVGCGGSSGEGPAEEEAPAVETIEAPIDVQMLYGDRGWTFEKSGTSVSVETDIDMDGDGSEIAKNVCNLTLYSVDGAEVVVVTGLNGREGCKRWDSE